jgi:hypothetical protein
MVLGAEREIREKAARGLDRWQRLEVRRDALAQSRPHFCGERIATGDDLTPESSFGGRSLGQNDRAA